MAREELKLTGYFLFRSDETNTTQRISTVRTWTRKQVCDALSNMARIGMGSERPRINYATLSAWTPVASIVFVDANGPKLETIAGFGQR